ncbi:MAG: hypothetical protein KC561_08115, partial [Myxococcales bacterium]|nr:hypothetical protein [Myxococcales bacterium]
VPHPDSTNKSTLEQLLMALWEGLEVEARSVLSICGLFSGGFEAKQVADLTRRVFGDIDPHFVHLQQLLQRHLLSEFREGAAGRHFALNQTVRRFVLDRLAEDEGLWSAARAHHAEMFGERALGHLSAYNLGDDPAGLERLRPLIPNLRAAIDYCLGEVDGVPARAKHALLATMAEVHSQFGGALELSSFERAAPGPGDDAFVAPCEATAWFFYFWARVVNRCSRRADAELAFERALEIAKPGQHPGIRALVVAQWAIALQEWGAAEQGMEACEATIAIIRETCPPVPLSFLMATTGFMYVSRGEFDAAVDWQRRALGELSDDRYRAWRFHTLIDLAFAETQRGSASRATSALQEARTILESSGTPWQWTDLLAAEGILESFRGNFESAVQRLTSAIDNTARSGVSGAYQRIALLLNLGLAEAAVGSWDAAEGVFATATALAERRRLGRALAYGCAGLGEVAFFRGEPQDHPMSALTQALNLGREQGEPEIVGRSSALLALFFHRSGAHAQRDEHLAILRSVANPQEHLSPGPFWTDGLVRLIDAAVAGENSLQETIGELLSNADYRQSDSLHSRYWTNPHTRCLIRHLLEGLPEAIRERIETRATVSESTLLVGEDGRGFQAPGGVWVDLSDKQVLADLLWSLARAHEQESGRPLHWTDLIERAWGEKPSESDHDRVRRAVLKLRESGLGDLVKTVRGRGYLLDPEATIRIL